MGIAVLSAPSNLGLRPPRPGSVPGAAKAPEALREAGLLGGVHPAREVTAGSSRTVADMIRAVVAAAGRDGYWLHLDVDVLDRTHMPAVDSPAPDGLDPDQLIGLLRELAPGAVGAQVTVFDPDPDLDPDGRGAVLLRDVIATGFAELGCAARGR